MLSPLPWRLSLRDFQTSTTGVHLPQSRAQSKDNSEWVRKQLVSSHIRLLCELSCQKNIAIYLISLL